MFIFKTMSRIFYTVCLLVSLLSSTASGQNGVTQVVGYDPLFWKAELRLNTQQCIQLRDINAEFYKSLEACANDNTKHNIEKTRIIQLLSNRSEQILNVFSYRQRKKWEKIAVTYQGNIVAALSFSSSSMWVNN
jgi:hypothetical protein